MEHHSFKQSFYKKYIPNNSIIYDLGAHIGALAFNFSLMGYKVYAFEGSPLNIQTLEDQAHLYPPIFIIPVALGTEKKDVLTKFNNSLAPLGEYTEQFIKFRVLEDFVKENNIPDPSLIKIDIEGMESVVLLGCKRLLEIVRPIWQLSLHETITFKANHYPGFVTKENGGFDFSTFKKLNYNLYDMDLNKVNEIVGDAEYFLVPKEKDL